MCFTAGPDDHRGDERMSRRTEHGKGHLVISGPRRRDGFARLAMTGGSTPLSQFLRVGFRGKATAAIFFFQHRPASLAHQISNTSPRHAGRGRTTWGLSETLPLSG
jgi:hypothetical protein